MQLGAAASECPTSEYLAAAHDAVRALLLGPERSLTPLAVTRTAVILGSRDSLPVSVVTADAVALPGSLVLPVPSARLQRSELFAGLGMGSAATVGHGRLQVGPLRVRAGRWWSSPQRRAPSSVLSRGDGASALTEAERQLWSRRAALTSQAFPLSCQEAELAARATVFATAVLAAEQHSTLAAAADLLGLGPGLTPTGDDVIAGVLVAAHRVAPEPLSGGVLAPVLDLAWQRTAPVSAALLGWAARGQGVAPLLAYVDALALGAPTDAALDRLAGVGHTSGLDLAVGALAAVGQLGRRSDSQLHRSTDPAAAWPAPLPVPTGASS